MSRTTGRKRKDRPRIIGTFSERVLLHQLAHEVFIRLPELHPDLDIEYEYFAHMLGHYESGQLEYYFQIYIDQ